MIPYARQSIDEHDIAAVVQVLGSEFLTQGPVVLRFEDAVLARCGSAHAVATSSATAALHIAVLALGIGGGDLVWTSPNSFVASANCARFCGAEVDFVDIDPQTYNPCIEELERKLSIAAQKNRLPKALIAVDFAGQPCDFTRIAELREKYGFSVIEDASHALGAEYHGRRIGSGNDADITVFSFHPVKIATTGEGGMALTNDVGLAQRMRLFRSHGVTRDPAQMAPAEHEPWEYEQVVLGYNYRMTDLLAALGCAQVARLDAFLERRRAIAARYDRELASLPLTLPWQAPGRRSSYHLYPILVGDESPRNRRALYDGLCERGIAPNVHYMPIHLQPYYRRLGFSIGDFPVAERYYGRTLSLPMYVDLSDAQQQRVIDALREILA